MSALPFLPALLYVIVKSYLLTTMAQLLILGFVGSFLNQYRMLDVDVKVSRKSNSYYMKFAKT